jgi:hypothetical protein
MKHRANNRGVPMQPLEVLPPATGGATNSLRIVGGYVAMVLGRTGSLEFSWRGIFLAHWERCAMGCGRLRSAAQQPSRERISMSSHSNHPSIFVRED